MLWRARTFSQTGLSRRFSLVISFFTSLLGVLAPSVDPCSPCSYLCDGCALIREANATLCSRVGCSPHSCACDVVSRGNLANGTVRHNARLKARGGHSSWPPGVPRQDGASEDSADSRTPQQLHRIVGHDATASSWSNAHTLLLLVARPQETPRRHERALASSARHSSRAAALRTTHTHASPALMRRSPSRSISRTGSPMRTASSSPVRSSSRTTDWTVDGSRVRPPAPSAPLQASLRARHTDRHDLGLRRRMQTLPGVGGSVTYEYRASPSKLSTPMRAVVSGGVMERALVLDNDPDQAGRRALTKASWHGSSSVHTPGKYRIDVQALARQAALPVAGAGTPPSPGPRTASSGSDSSSAVSRLQSKEQSSSTARALLSDGMSAREHSQNAAAADSELSEALGDGVEQSEERAIRLVGAELSEARGGVIPGYQLERYQQIQSREMDHESAYKATDARLQAQLNSPEKTVSAAAMSMSGARITAGLRAGSPGRGGLSTRPSGMSPGRRSPMRTFSSPGRGVGGDSVTRRLSMSPGRTGAGGGSGVGGSGLHPSLSTPRRPGTTLSDRGKLEVPPTRLASTSATVAESLSAGVAATYIGVGQMSPENPRGSTATLPPRDKSSASVSSSLWTDGISGQLEGGAAAASAALSPGRRVTPFVMAASPPARTLNLSSSGSGSGRRSPGRAGGRLLGSSPVVALGTRGISTAMNSGGFKSPPRSRSSSGAAQHSAAKKISGAAVRGPAGTAAASMAGLIGTSSSAVQVDAKLTDMAAKEHERAAMEADMRFKEAIKGLDEESAT